MIFDLSPDSHGVPSRRKVDAKKMNGAVFSNADGLITECLDDDIDVRQAFSQAVRVSGMGDGESLLS